MAEEVTVYYAQDTVNIDSVLKYAYEGDYEVTLPSAVEVSDHAHFQRDVECPSVVTASESVLPILFASDSMSVSSTYEMGGDVTKASIILISDEATLVQMITHPYLYSVVEVRERVRYQIISAVGIANEWIKLTQDEEVWTKA